VSPVRGSPEEWRFAGVDLISRLRPDKRFRVLLVDGEVVGDGSLDFGRAALRSSAYPLFGEKRMEPPREASRWFQALRIGMATPVAAHQAAR